MALAFQLRGALVAGRYRLLERIGAGGGGPVYEAIDTTTDRLRAIKLLEDQGDPHALERFRRETTLGGRVESRHLVEVLDAGHDATRGVHYVVMERLRGEDLGKALARRGRFSFAETLAILRQVREGLDPLHKEGIVHRDLKPDNVFLVASAGALWVKVLDLGLAKRFDTLDFKTTRVCGTPGFMAPEQLRGEALVDQRADVYAFAHLAFQLLVGKRYHQPELERCGSLYAVLLAIANGPTEAASARGDRLGVALPRAFDDWFARASSGAPEARFDDLGQSIDALEQALSDVRDQATSAPNACPRRQEAKASTSTGSGSPSPARRPRRLRWVERAVVVAVVGLASVAVARPFTNTRSARVTPLSPMRYSAPRLEPSVPVLPPRAATQEEATAPAAAAVVVKPVETRPARLWRDTREPGRIAASPLSTPPGRPRTSTLPKPSPSYNPLDVP